MKETWTFDRDRLRACRAMVGLSAERFADKIGVTHQTVLNWEREKGTPNGDDISMIATVFNVMPLAFFKVTR